MTRALQQLGDYKKNPAFSEFHEISSRSWSLYHGETAPRAVTDPLHHVVKRMMYVGEATSAALRLNASWALTHPAFSLCRDRFEQTVRFSWLARQKDEGGWLAYLNHYELAVSKLKNAFAQRKIDPLVELASKLDKCSKEEKAIYEEWSKKPLEQLARERELLPGFTKTKVDTQKIDVFYESIYRQGSSVSHFDAYSIKMLGLHRNGSQLILAPDPYFPIVLVLHNSLFDVIMCAEGATKFGCELSAKPWNDLVDRWWSATKETGILDS